MFAITGLMILSAEALDIVSFLETARDKFVSMLEISRRAGGRRRYEESPGWAKNLMPSMLAEGLVEVNARGHYRLKSDESPAPEPNQAALAASPPTWNSRGKVVGDDYFPSCDMPRIVGGD